ncbi:hypothetical protein [Streptomyces sp. NBC_00470]|uniref:hypothetical protein n=1 Tax=Streptomyces sp. NBC_00470 TaxID=2975753 RepID=UPI002F914AF1
MPTLRTVHSVHDLDESDINKIEAFITTLTAAQAAAHEADSNERKMAHSVTAMVRMAADSARLTRARMDDPDDAVDEYQLRDAWNMLVRGCDPWLAEPGYDHARWNYLGTPHTVRITATPVTPSQVPGCTSRASALASPE